MFCEQESVVIAIQSGGLPHSYPIVRIAEGRGIPGVVRKLKGDKADVAVRRADGVTERMIVPASSLRKPERQAA